MDYYSLGKVRQFCPTLTEHKLRRACELGLIDSRRSDGGRWQISAEGVEVLKRDGIPPLPVRAETDESAPAEKEAPVRIQATPASRDRIFDEPDEAPEVQAEITRYHQTVQRSRRKVAELDEADVDDQMTERKHRQAQERQAKQEEERQRTAQVKRKEWEESQLNTVMEQSARLFEPEQCTAIIQAAQVALKTLPSDVSDDVLKKVLLVAMSKAIRPFICQAQRDKAIHQALGAFPYNAGADWRLRGRREALAALQALGPEADAEEMELVAQQAVESLVRECRHLDNVNGVLATVDLYGATAVERNKVKREAAAELKKAPVGVSVEELRAMAKDVQEQNRNAIELRQAAERNLSAALDHIEKYLSDPDEFEWDGPMERYFKAQELTQQIRPLLIERQRTGSGTAADLRRFVEQYIDQEMEAANESD